MGTGFICIINLRHFVLLLLCVKMLYSITEKFHLLQIS